MSEPTPLFPDVKEALEAVRAATKALAAASRESGNRHGLKISGAVSAALNSEGKNGTDQDG